YIRGNFFQGLSFNSLRDLNAQARTWLDHVANVRVHGTTREVPFVRWQERERSALRSITVPPYDTSIVSRRNGSRAGFVVARTNLSSVPWQFAGQWLVTRGDPDGWLEILDGDEVVAVHPLLPESTRYRPVLMPEPHVVPADHAEDNVRVLPAPD